MSVANGPRDGDDGAMTEQPDQHDQQDQAVEEQIARWRDWLRRRPPIRPSDVDELEGHLRDQIAALVAAGLAGDEAFLVAVKRMGSLDAVSREFAREHSDRLWKQLVAAPRRGRRPPLPPPAGRSPSSSGSRPRRRSPSRSPSSSATGSKRAPSTP